MFRKKLLPLVVVLGSGAVAYFLRKIIKDPEKIISDEQINNAPPVSLDEVNIAEYKRPFGDVIGNFPGGLGGEIALKLLPSLFFSPNVRKVEKSYSARYVVGIISWSVVGISMISFFSIIRRISNFRENTQDFVVISKRNQVSVHALKQISNADNHMIFGMYIFKPIQEFISSFVSGLEGCNIDIDEIKNRMLDLLVADIVLHQNGFINSFPKVVKTTAERHYLHYKLIWNDIHLYKGLEEFLKKLDVKGTSENVRTLHYYIFKVLFLKQREQLLSDQNLNKEHKDLLKIGGFSH